MGERGTAIQPSVVVAAMLASAVRSGIAARSSPAVITGNGPGRRPGPAVDRPVVAHGAPDLGQAPPQRPDGIVGVGEQPVRLPVHRVRRLRVRRFDQAEDLPPAGRGSAAALGELPFRLG
jgi:hypothetical protein